MTSGAAWPRPPLRRICTIRYGDSLAADERIDGDVPVHGSNGAVGTHDVANTSAPVIVIGRKGSHGKLQYSAAPVFAIDTTFFVDRRTSQCDLRWLYYAMSTLGLDELTSDVGVPGLSREHAYDQILPLPPSATQLAIAEFLDAETARLDALIAKKRDLNQLLEARWQTMVREVAHGSGWALVPLRRLWTVTDCKHRTPVYVTDGFPVVSPGDVTPGRLDLRRCHRFVDGNDLDDLTEDRRRPGRGDIIYTRNASIGIAAYVDNDQPFTMGQDVCLIRSETEDQLWLMYMLNSVGFDQLAEMKIGSTFDRVNIAQLLDLHIPVPPRDTQSAAAQRLDEERQRVNRLHATIQEQIALLSEHRQALITAAVTGELDIPGAA